MSLTTPDKIRTLQRKLYLKAKAEPNFRFYLLYDKVYRADILRHAYDLARANKGAPGVDGVDFAAIEAAGLENWLDGIETELRTKTYQPQPVRRVMIPKPGGGERPLGIPTIRDRVVQTAAKLVLEPIFEADLEPTAYGYRPGRSGIDAVKAVHRLLCQGFTDVVDADLSKYFDTIPHDELLRSVAARVVDRHVLRLIKAWLKAPVEETDLDGRRRMSGGKQSTCGTPQGGVMSLNAKGNFGLSASWHWRLEMCLIYVAKGNIYMSYGAINDAQKSERLNAAHSLLARGMGMSEAAVSLSRQFGLSRRQAYRYLQEAETIGHPVPVIAPSVPITFKVPADIVREVRAYSVISGLTLSEIVTRAITAFLTAVRGHG